MLIYLRCSSTEKPCILDVSATDALQGKGIRCSDCGRGSRLPWSWPFHRGVLLHRRQTGHRPRFRRLPSAAVLAGRDASDELLDLAAIPFGFRGQLSAIRLRVGEVSIGASRLIPPPGPDKRSPDLMSDEL